VRRAKPSNSDGKRIELVWPGKTCDVEYAEAPLQTVEIVEGHGASGKGWRNKLIWGDNKDVMGALMAQLAGRVNLIYIDPPFGTGAEFPLATGRHNGGEGRGRFSGPAYSDKWREGMASYLQSMYERLVLMHRLLSDTGSIYLHCDWRTNSALRLIMDEIFGPRNFLNEIIWIYGLGGSSRRYWPRKHDTILWYCKRRNKHVFKPVLVPATSLRMKGMDKKCPDCWEIAAINNMAHERTEYATQKPEALLERIILSSSNEGDIVADFFCGSGTTGVVAERLRRRWIMCDTSRWAIHVARKRLLEMGEASDCKQRQVGDFEIQRVSNGNLPPWVDEEAGTVQVAVRRDPDCPRRVAIELTGYRPNAQRQAQLTSQDLGHWSEYLDYWAVDWNHRGDVFGNQWHSCRTRGNPKLATISTWHTYDKPGSYNVMLRAFDILGSETATVITVKIP